MDKYTIYCTEEQTKKAIELGAPIKKAETRHDLYNNRYCFIEGIEPAVIIPTAEQMLGWLEEQEPIKEIAICRSRYGWCIDIFNEDYELVNMYVGTFDSRKKTTLAAIDAALDYLIKAKEE